MFAHCANDGGGEEKRIESQLASSGAAASSIPIAQLGNVHARLRRKADPKTLNVVWRTTKYSRGQELAG